MLIAINQQNQQITAHKDLSKQDHYSCPACQSPVHLKAGSVMRPHFAHFKKAHCAVFSEGETEEHLEGKQQLYNWLKSLGHTVEMEAYLPEMKQRPDILLKSNREAIAVEFQCSPISIEKVKERTEGYVENGYKVIWVLGNQLKYRRMLTAFHKVCLTHLENQLILFHYSVKSKRLEYHYDFHLKQNQKFHTHKQSIRYGNPLKLNLKKQKHYSNTNLSIEMEHEKLQRQLRYPTPKMKKFLNTLYQNNETLVSMPIELYRVTPSGWLINQHPMEWKLHFILWIESHKPYTVLTMKKIMKWSETLTYYEILQLTVEQKLKPIKEFIAHLCQSNILKQIRLDKWSVQQPAKRYQHLEDKFQ